MKNLQIVKGSLVNIFEYINSSLEKEYYQNKVPSKIKILYFFEKTDNNNIIKLNIQYNFYKDMTMVLAYSDYGIETTLISISLESMLSSIIKSSIIYAEELRDDKYYSKNLSSIAKVNAMYHIFKYVYAIYHMIYENGDEICKAENILYIIDNINIDERRVNNIFYMKDIRDRMDFCSRRGDIYFTEQSYTDVIKKCHIDPMDYLWLHQER